MLRKSEFLKNKKCRILLCIELFLLFAGIIMLFGKTGIVAGTEETDRLLAEGISLSSGVYTARIYYDTQEDIQGGFGVRVEEENLSALKSNPVTLYAGAGMAQCQFYLLDSVAHLCVYVENNGQTLEVKGVEIENGGQAVFMWVITVLFFSLLVNAGAVLLLLHRKSPFPARQQLIFWGISATVVVSSIPLMVDYLFFGADLIFHLGRIEALAQALLSGMPFSRIEPMWLAGHGYANSIFYCDTFLLFPAILRMAGFPLTISYQCYVTAVNLATALIAYTAFKRCFQSAEIGLLGCMLYTLSPYRLYNIYNRASVGEYTAMIFLPLLAWGFYRIFSADTKEKSYKRSWLIPTLGFSGIIQSHALTCEMAGGFAILLCLLMWKKVFRRQTFLVLLKMAAATALLNAWFLVPFVDLMTADSYYFGNNANVLIQSRGITLAHPFYTLQAGGSSSRFAENGMLDAEPITMGAALLAGTLLWLWLRFRKGFWEDRDKTRKKTADTAFLLGCIALYMSTSYFPWDKLSSAGSIAAALTGSLQFPTRLMVIVTLCMVFVSCAAWFWLLEGKGKFRPSTAKGILAGLGAVCVLFSMYQVDDILNTRASILRLDSAQNMGHSPILGAEYLPLDAQAEHMTYHEPVLSQGTEMSFYEKRNLQVNAYVETDGAGEHYVEFPLLYYKGYHGVNTDTGESLQVVKGDNADVRVLLPDHFSGNIQCSYTGMWYWHLAEAASAAAVLGIAVFVIRGRKVR